MIKGTPDDGKFFDLNRDFKIIPEFAALIAVYGLETADQYCWAIWYVHHPSSSIFELDPADKIEWVKETYLNDPDFEWPEKEIKIEVKPRKKGRPKKKGKKDMGVEFDDDEEEDNIDMAQLNLVGFKDTDLMFELTGVHREFYAVIEIFPLVAMSIEERDYYMLVRLRHMAMMRAEYLNGKDMASAIKQLASSSPDLDKMKTRYLSWKESGVKSGGEVQSGGASRRKKL